MIALRWRQPLRIFLAILIGALVYDTLQWRYGFWVPLMILLFLQGTVGETLRQGWRRFIGLLIGVFIGSSWLWWSVPTVLWREIAIVIIATLTFSLCLTRVLQRGWPTLVLTGLFGLLLALLVPEVSSHFVKERSFEVVVGAAIAVLVTLLIYPSTLKQQVETGVTFMLKQSAFYAGAIFSLFAGRTEEAQQHVQRQREQFLTHLRHHRHDFYNWLYELTGPYRKRRRYHGLLILTEELSQILLSLQLLAEQAWPKPTQATVAALLQVVDDKLKHLVATICLQTQDAPLLTEVDHFENELAAIRDLHSAALEKGEQQAAALLAWLLCDIESLGKIFQTMLRREQ